MLYGVIRPPDVGELVTFLFTILIVEIMHMFVELNEAEWRIYASVN